MSGFIYSFKQLFIGLFCKTQYNSPTCNVGPVVYFLSHLKPTAISLVVKSDQEVRNVRDCQPVDYR